MVSLYSKLQESIKSIQAKIKGFRPDIAVVLGSGLGGFADKVDVRYRIKYSEIPGFPRGKHVKGHRGELIFGEAEGKKLVLMAGRFHAYQGFPLQEATFPVRVLRGLGAKTLIVTNAAGGLNKKFHVGDLMIIDDHINGMATTPLVGIADERLGPQFVPMTKAYDRELVKLAERMARKAGIKTQKGVYIALTGPTYETRAEVRMYRQFADAVGMSTVPEVIVANQVGMRVLGISCITNVHDEESAPSHQEVIEAGKMAAARFEKLVSNIIKEL